MATQTIELTTPAGRTPVRYDDDGTGRVFLLLHGGAGPRSMTGFAQLLSTTRPARVVTPVHPGFDGTSRPAGLDSMPALAEVYEGLLARLDLRDVTVVGNSIGGWLGAELALRHTERIRRLVITDAVGLASDTEPIVDFFALTMDQVTDLSYAEPDRFRTDVRALPASVRDAMPGNRAALEVYGGRTMTDQTLAGRLPGIRIPTLVVWGAADRVVRPSHGRTYAAAIPDARFELYDDAGHLPQIETPARLVDDVWSFSG